MATETPDVEQVSTTNIKCIRIFLGNLAFYQGVLQEGDIFRHSFLYLTSTPAKSCSMVSGEGFITSHTFVMMFEATAYMLDPMRSKEKVG